MTYLVPVRTNLQLGSNEPHAPGNKQICDYRKMIEYEHQTGKERNFVRQQHDYNGKM